MNQPHEACGVAALYAPKVNVGRQIAIALSALQHRGQESAGIATADGEQVFVHKGMGLVTRVFGEHELAGLSGHVGIGHTRYSTTGTSHARNIQPHVVETSLGPLAVAHNGNLTNARELRAWLLARGVGFTSTTDSEIIMCALATPTDTWANDVPSNLEPSDPWIGRIRAFMSAAQGAYSLTILTRDATYAVRDPHGFRPLVLGYIDGQPVVVSETCALRALGADFEREIEPGEIVRLGVEGATSIFGHEPATLASCIFEHIYFARADSYLDGQVAYDIRMRLGRELAKEAPATADIVVGVPDSARPAAVGYSMESAMPYSEGLIRNNYVGRTFIEPGDELRRSAVDLKYAPLLSVIRGKRVVLVDDSIVWGETSAHLTRILHKAGAAEVHLRICSPPIRHPCYMGIDMGTYQQLLAHRLDVQGMCAWIGSDSLGFLSVQGMLSAVRDVTQKDLGYCTACFSGLYPSPLPNSVTESSQEKRAFEGVWGN
ncbi:MAG TPA: amidophosphoribosyltransferase [Ktedonobacteraceae bacterium]|jgi:amidophosphoribosyltransferase